MAKEKTVDVAAESLKANKQREKKIAVLERELASVFPDLTEKDVKILAEMNVLENSVDRANAIQYFWAAKKLNA